MRGSSYPFKTDSIAALILNSFQSIIDRPLISSPFLDLKISASSTGLVVRVPEAAAASPSVLARPGSTPEILTAKRKRRVLANFFHFSVVGAVGLAGL